MFGVLRLGNKNPAGNCPRDFLPGLASKLKFQLIHNGLNFCGHGWVFIGMMEDDGQNNRAVMLFERKPLIGQQDRRFSIHENAVMIVSC
jgi:hypothetical protein